MQFQLSVSSLFLWLTGRSTWGNEDKRKIDLGWRTNITFRKKWSRILTLRMTTKRFQRPRRHRLQTRRFMNQLVKSIQPDLRHPANLCLLWQWPPFAPTFHASKRFCIWMTHWLLEMKWQAKMPPGFWLRPLLSSQCKQVCMDQQSGRALGRAFFATFSRLVKRYF